MAAFERILVPFDFSTHSESAAQRAAWIAGRTNGEAERIGANLIVVGSRGHTGLKHLLLGSVAERTVRLAPCAVLALKTTTHGAAD